MKREHIICERNNLDMKEYQSVRNIREEIHKVRFFFHPVNNSWINFFVLQIRNRTRDQNSGKGAVIQVNA